MDLKPVRQAPGPGAEIFDPLSGRGALSGKEKLETLAREFESILFHQMIRSMRETVQRSGLVEESPGERIFTDMLDERMAREMAFSQDGGLAAALAAQLSAMADGGKEKEAGQNKPEAGGESGR